MSGSNETVHLTPAERRLLDCLVRNAGRIVSHRELLEAMSIARMGTLRQWIRHLRKKIEIDPALPRVIMTHHRQGYSFAGREEARWFLKCNIYRPRYHPLGE